MFGPYRYGTLQFSSFDEIRDVGYYHGKTYFSGTFQLTVGVIYDRGP